MVSDENLDDATKVRVITELIDMTRRTIEGQALDIGWARDGRYDITPEDYLVMATHKTAHYSGAVPLAIGAIIGGILSLVLPFLIPVVIVLLLVRLIMMIFGGW